MKNPNLNENVANGVQGLDLASLGLNGNAVVVNAADLDNGDVLRLPLGSYLLLNVDSPLNVSARITDGNAVLISLPDGRFFTVKLEGAVLASGEIPIYIQQDGLGATSGQATQLYQFDVLGGQGDLQVVAFSRNGFANSSDALHSLAGEGSGGDAGFNALASTTPGGNDGLNSLVGGGLGLGSNALISGDGSLSGAISASSVGSGGSAIAGAGAGSGASVGSSNTSSGNSDTPDSTTQSPFDAALSTVVNYADGTGAAPNLVTYQTLGISGITAANLDGFNSIIERKTGGQVDTQGEIQTVAVSFERISAEAGDADLDGGDNVDPTAEDYANVGVSLTADDEIALLNSAIRDQPEGSLDGNADILYTMAAATQRIVAIVGTGIGSDHEAWWGNNATQMHNDLAALGIDVHEDTIPGILVDLAQANVSINTVAALEDFVLNQSIGGPQDNCYTDSLVKAINYTYYGGGNDGQGNPTIPLSNDDFVNLGITQLAGNTDQIDTINALLARENLQTYNMGGAYKIKALIEGYQATTDTVSDLQADNVNGVDVLVGDDNSNVFTLNAGRDIAFGDGGDDTFNITADVVNEFGFTADVFSGASVIDGGSGTDTIRLNAASAVVLDFTQIDLNASLTMKIKDIEVIDIGLHDIILATDDVLAMTDADNELTIDLVSGGAVNLQGGFQQEASSSKAGYLEFTSGNATVFVNDDIASGDLVFS